MYYIMFKNFYYTSNFQSKFIETNSKHFENVMYINTSKVKNLEIFYSYYNNYYLVNISSYYIDVI